MHQSLYLISKHVTASLYSAIHKVIKFKKKEEEVDVKWKIGWWRKKKKISINNDFAVNDSFIENGEEHLAFLTEI